MKNKKLTKAHILSYLGGAAVLTATGVTVASCTSNIAVEKSIVTADKDEINIVAGIGEPQQIKFNGKFYDKNNNEVNKQVKFLTNLDAINYYGNLPKDLITFSDDGVLTVDPKKCTDLLLDETWQINVWAQTTNDKLTSDQMTKKTIKFICKHDDSVPRYAKITSQSDNCVTLACGSEQGEKEVKFDITYWSSVEGEYYFDNTKWSVIDRGDLPETCELTFKNGETLGEGILTIDAQNCTLATNQTYNIKVQGQSTKCPSVIAAANLEINLTGDVTPTEATILGNETVDVDPNAPSTYKFDYSCRVTNQGDEVIDNSPLRWTLNEAQVKTLSDAGIDVEVKNNQLLVSTINCKSKLKQ
ncbi:MAG: hypothetical protein HUJ52_04080 [Malacoplasma sp.]|nr:hypothetical protein [Malacoplasma sp.]